MNNWLNKEKEEYRKKHEKSGLLWERAQKHIPGGVSHNIRDFHMPPLGLWPPFIKSGKDCNVYDVEGNQYTDYWLTHGSAILGHSHKAVIDAISEQLPKGIHFGMVNEQASDLADMIIEATPCVEKLRFCTTGTEATMYATRLARAYTKKKKILKVRGGWHGGNDTLFYFVKHVQEGMESKGLQSVEEAEILSFDYNDIEGFHEIIKQNKNDISAVVMEPVLGAGGAIPPIEGFLETIREETERNNILLIFDEVITGFRLDYHSAQGYFNVIPDLVTMGKIVGGGTPIGVLGGKDEILEQANLQKGGDVWIGGGTFSSNPLSMVAGKATLETLKQDKTKIYEDLNANGKKIRESIEKILLRYDAPAIVTGVGSMICIHWLKEKLSQLSTGSEVKLNLDRNKVEIFQLLMFNREILIRSGFGYLSIKHTTNVYNETLTALEESVKIITQGS